jgi:hypothetical protein
MPRDFGVQAVSVEVDSIVRFKPLLQREGLPGSFSICCGV